MENETRDLIKERHNKERTRILKLLRQTESMLTQPSTYTDGDTYLLQNVLSEVMDPKFQINIATNILAKQIWQRIKLAAD